MQARHVTVGDVPCWALRVTYVGELGWELYPTIEYGVRLWDTLLEVGRPHGLVPGGYRAIDSLRLEKGYRVWGADITSETDPYSSGLGFAVRAEREFLGGAALPATSGGPSRSGVPRARRRRGPSRSATSRCAMPMRPSSDAISSGGLGYSLERSIAYAWLPAAHADVGTQLSVEVFGEMVGAVVTAEPLFDPAGHRIRA